MASKDDKGYYNSERKGYETKDGGLIRISGDDKVRIDIYEGNEREKGGHTRDTINYDSNNGKGRVDQHNEDKSENSSTDINCFLTTACMKHFQIEFDDTCYELTLLRWFRDSFISKEDIKYYYEIAPIIVENIDKTDKSNTIYNYIYDNLIVYCVKEIECENYKLAYNRYKNIVLTLEEKFLKPVLVQKLTRTLKIGVSNDKNK